MRAEYMQFKIGIIHMPVMDTGRGLDPIHAAVGASTDLGGVFVNRQAHESKLVVVNAESALWLQKRH